MENNVENMASLLDHKLAKLDPFLNLEDFTNAANVPIITVRNPVPGLNIERMAIFTAMSGRHFCLTETFEEAGPIITVRTSANGLHSKLAAYNEMLSFFDLDPEEDIQQNAPAKDDPSISAFFSVGP